VASALPLKSEFVYSSGISSVHEIETAVSRLSRQELLAFHDWFSGFDAAACLKDPSSALTWEQFKEKMQNPPSIPSSSQRW